MENGHTHNEGPGSLPEARFMYESIDAAKALLTIVNNYIPSAESLNRFPIRFPLYVWLDSKAHYIADHEAGIASTLLSSYIR
jgi:hypothetical protein